MRKIYSLLLLAAISLFGAQNVMADTWTVAGSSAEVFGTTWDATNTANDMVDIDGTFTFAKENVLLPAGNIEFKVVKNHNWDAAAYPANNYVLNTISTAGFYNLTITFVPSSESVSATATLVPATEFKRLYFRATADWWKWDTDGATVPCAYAWVGDYKNNVWPGASMQPVEDEVDTWFIDVDARFEDVIFTRVLASTGVYKGIKTPTFTIPADKDLYTLTKATYDWDNYYEELLETDGEWSVFTPYVPTLANGYYLMGVVNGAAATWTIADLSSNRLLVVNPGNASEYIITTTLAEGDELQIVEVRHDAITNWYPGGVGKNYIIGEGFGGLKTIYFNSKGEGGDGWHYGYIYIGSAIYARAAENTNWGTICLPYNATLDNAEAFNIQSISASGIVVDKEEGTLVAGKTYLIRALTVGSITAHLSGSKVLAPIDNNGLYGNLDEDDVIIAANDANYDYYILSENTFHHLESSAQSSVAQYKGYLRVAKASEAPSIIRIIENATNIENIEANGKAVKFIENGRILIMKEGVVYDMMGAVVR